MVTASAGSGLVVPDSLGARGVVHENSSHTTAALFAILCAGDPPDGLVHCFGGYFHLKGSQW